MRILVRLALLVALLAPAIVSASERVRVRAYTKKDGTRVEAHERSAPNAFKWDNDSYSPSQPAFNPSYYRPTKNYGSGWYEPNPHRFLDSNPHNDYPPVGSSVITFPHAAVSNDSKPAKPILQLPAISAESRASRKQDVSSKGILDGLEESNFARPSRPKKQEPEDDLLERIRLLRAVQQVDDDNDTTYRPNRGRTFTEDDFLDVPSLDSDDTSVGTKLNPFSGEFESAPANYQLRYNAMENTWNYASPDASLKYDAINNSWGFEE